MLKFNDMTNRIKYMQTENNLESSRRVNPIRQYLDGEHITSEQKNSYRKLHSSSENIKCFNQSQNTPIEVTKKFELSQFFEATTPNITKGGNGQQDGFIKYADNKESIDVVKYKNDQIQDLTKQITQLKIQIERLQRRILEQQYEMENAQKEGKNIDNLQFQEKVLEERQISIRKSELEIEEITKELKRESEAIVKQRQVMQQESLVYKKQVELLAKEQERLNEEAKKLKLWEEKITEQDKSVRERILKFENRDELLNQKENALKKHEAQIEQKRIFVLQIIERLGQHDEQLYSYSKQCEQRCEKIDQFQNLLYNQIMHHEDIDLRMEGLRLNESIFQKKMDLEMSQCINQVQKLKEKESHLDKRERLIQLQNEKKQQAQQNQQKLAKSMDKPIAYNEYNILKQAGQSQKAKNVNSSNYVSSSENLPTSTSTQVSQLQFKNKSQQRSNSSSSSQGKSFKRINTSQQNYSLQINGKPNDSQIENKGKSNSRQNSVSQRKRRSESHQTLSHSAINLNNNTYQHEQQTTLLSFDNNLDLTITNHQNSQNPIIKLNQFASQEDISLVLPPSNVQNNGILMTSYHLDEDIAYLCQDGQKEGEQVRQISIMASPQLHFSEQTRQQQLLLEQYQTFQKETQPNNNVLTKGTHCGSSSSKHSELKLDLSSLNSKNENQNEKQLNPQSSTFNNIQFQSLPNQQLDKLPMVFTNQFNDGSIANEIIHDDNLLSNRDYCNAEELELIRKNRKETQTPQSLQKSSKLKNKNGLVLQEISLIAKGDVYYPNQQQNHIFEKILE